MALYKGSLYIPGALVCTKQYTDEWKPFQFEMLSLTYISQCSFHLQRCQWIDVLMLINSPTLHSHSAKHLYSVTSLTFPHGFHTWRVHLHLTGLELLDTMPLLTDSVKKPNGGLGTARPPLLQLSGFLIVEDVTSSAKVRRGNRGVAIFSIF